MKRKGENSMKKWKWRYKGPVLKFNDIIATDFEMETIAESKGKAIAQMTYRFKKDHNLEANTRITIKEDLVKMDASQVYMY